MTEEHVFIDRVRIGSERGFLKQTTNYLVHQVPDQRENIMIFELQRFRHWPKKDIL